MNVVRAKMRTMESLRLDATIEDILITLNKAVSPDQAAEELPQRAGLFLYLVLDRAKSNLALARHNVRRIEADLTI